MGENIYFLIVVATLGAFLLTMLLVILQIKNQNRLLAHRRALTEEKIRHKDELLRTFVISQEAERRRIGMDLHDQAGTVLSSLRMHIDGDKDRSKDDWNMAAKELIDRIIHHVRLISHDLSPFVKEVYELREALEEIAARTNSGGMVRADMVFNDTGNFIFLTDEAQLALYRVLSELINNTLKHASASGLRIIFHKTMSDPMHPETFILDITYTDDGKGMSPSTARQPGRGLMNIETRLNMLGAVYSIDPPGKNGFAMRIKLPFNEHRGNDSDR